MEDKQNMNEDNLIERINALARKSRTDGLTAMELKEQKTLRTKYIAGFRRSMTATLENIRIVDAEGNETKPTPKEK